MQKYLYFIGIVVFLILITACGSSGDIKTEQQEKIEQEIINKEKNNEIVNKEKNNVEIKKDQGKQVSNVVEEQTKPPVYTLQSDYTVKPLDKSSGGERVVLLTIDDAPDRYSLEIAKLLKEKNIDAIFFVNGHFLIDEAGREKLRKIYKLGFEIGNHTMTHSNLKTLSAEKQRQEIIEVNNLIEEITGVRPRFFRAPFGVNTEVSRQVVSEEGMQAMNWTYGYDFEKEYMEKEALTDIMINTNLLRPGANLLMHDRLWTLEALPEIIAGIKEKGYGFVDPKFIK